jgi:adenylate cyclase
MGQEIERKFLTCDDRWRGLAAGTLYRQGYVKSDRGHGITVKTVSAPGRTSGFIQVASPVLPKSVEFLIPIAEAIVLLDALCIEVQESYQQGVRTRSGALSSQSGHTLRFRLAGEQGIFTIKTKTVGISRSEFEFEIPKALSMQMLNLICEQPQIEKYRYKIPYAGLIWEVDDFLGKNQGLVIAEVELESESQLVEKPDWIGPEVSGDRRYYNSYLVKRPFQTWKD